MKKLGGNGVLTDMEIIENILVGSDVEEEEQEHDNPKPPSALEALNTYKNFSHFFVPKTSSYVS